MHHLRIYHYLISELMKVTCKDRIMKFNVHYLLTLTLLIKTNIWINSIICYHQQVLMNYCNQKLSIFRINKCFTYFKMAAIGNARHVYSRYSTHARHIYTTIKSEVYRYTDEEDGLTSAWRRTLLSVKISTKFRPITVDL